MKHPTTKHALFNHYSGHYDVQRDMMTAVPFDPNIGYTKDVAIRLFDDIIK